MPIMRAREEVAAELEEKLDSVAEDIRSEYYNLGLYLFENADSLDIPMGKKLFDGVKEAECEKQRSKELLDDSKKFISEYKEKAEMAENLKDQINVKRGENKMIKLRLGALIYEQCSLSLLDSSLFSEVYKDAKEEKRYRDKAESNAFLDRIFSKHGKAKMQRNNDSRFLSYAEYALDKKAIESLSGDNAKDLYKDAESSTKELKELSSSLDDLNAEIKAMEDRRRTLEKGDLERQENASFEAEDRLREQVIGYGNYLFDKGASWIGETTPTAVLDYLDSILKKQQEYSSLTNTMARLKKEAKADDFKALIEEEKAKILILQKEKERIDMQIAQIENEIERLEGSIDRLSLK